MGLFGAGDPPCPAGTICSGQARTKVGGTVQEVQETVPGTQGSTRTVKKLVGGTDIYHATVTTPIQGADGKITGGKTEVYIIKDGSWQKAATTTDGGQTYTYDDNVAGAALKKDLNDKASAISKNTQAGTSKALTKAGITSPVEKKAIVDSLSNTTSPTPDPNDATPVDAEKLGKKIGEGTGRTDSYGSLIYPLDIANSQDKIRFTILQYKPRGVKGGTFGTEDISTLNARSSTEGRKELGTITLPIPGGISDTNTVGWGDDRMDPFKMALANASLQAIMDGFEAGASVVSTAASRVTEPSTSADTAGAAGTLLASAAVQGDGGLLLSRTQGAVINPNLELLFSGPELRSFNFTFKMSARNKPEADMIVKIIRAFKQASAPQRTKSQLFVKAPNTFNIQYLHKTEKGGHTRIGRIKECALLSINTNYTPEGQYATYGDGTPISYEIQLQFKELEPIFNSDYEAQGITRNDIGY